MTSNLIVLIGGMLIVIGTFLGAYGTFLNAEQQNSQQQKIADLQLQMANTITGGDSYARLGLVLDSGNFGWVHVIIEQRGDYPVYDTQIYLRNMTRQADLTQEMVEKGYSFQDILKNTEWTIDAGNLGPKQRRALMKIHLPDKRKEQDFEATVTSRNGSRSYEFWFRLINGKWVRGVRVKEGDKLLESKIDPSIPLNEHGEPTGTALISRPWPIPPLD